MTIQYRFEWSVSGALLLSVLLIIFAGKAFASGLAEASGGDADVGAAFQRVKVLAQSGDVIAMYNEAYMYENGLGVQRNIQHAIRWYRTASSKGLGAAGFNLALIYDKGEGVTKDPRMAVIYYKASADNGFVKSMTNLGFMYLSGRGVQKSADEAFHYLSEAAYRGDGHAQVQIGVMYGNGVAVKKDIGRAYAWFAVARKQGAPAAERNYMMAKRLLSADELTAAQKMENRIEAEMARYTATSNKQ